MAFYLYANDRARRGQEAILRTRTERAAFGIAAALTAALAGLTLAACKSSVECTADVTAGAGTFKATAEGAKNEVRSVRRQAVKNACSKMCSAKDGGSVDACSARCVVDAEAGKVGAVTKCGDER
jgi:hypothetical protein